MKDEEVFRAALADKQIPVLTLDTKWHRLFAVHGKTEDILVLEHELNELISKQGRYNQELKDLRQLKSKLMGSIVRNMEGANEDMAASIESRKLDENRRLMEEVNQRIEELADYLLELPHLIQSKNKELMIATMQFGYEKIRQNDSEAAEISEWIANIRTELKKNIIRKQNCEINSREIYAYMHDVFGPQIVDLFDIIEYEKDGDSEEDSQPEE